MPYWLLKEEPTHYSYDDLVRDGRATWDGVRNPLAQKHLRRMMKGDRAFYYHTGKEKAIVAMVEVTKGAYSDPDDADYVVVDVKPAGRLPRPVTLAEIKADGRFSEFPLVRIGRLSVMPVPEPLWNAILEMANK